MSVARGGGVLNISKQGQVEKNTVPEQHSFDEFALPVARVEHVIETYQRSFQIIGVEA